MESMIPEYALSG
jgi:crotonobetainyl-CoA:carnitine CoA-transferase CaiB-like acyl-CoA transferase